jgi:hypothetical protein
MFLRVHQRGGATDVRQFPRYPTKLRISCSRTQPGALFAASFPGRVMQAGGALQQTRLVPVEVGLRLKGPGDRATRRPDSKGGYRVCMRKCPAGTICTFSLELQLKLVLPLHDRNGADRIRRGTIYYLGTDSEVDQRVPRLIHHAVNAGRLEKNTRLLTKYFFVLT